MKAKLCKYFSIKFTLKFKIIYIYTVIQFYGTRHINKPWRGCNLRTEAPQNLLQKGEKVKMRVGVPNTPPEFHLPLLLCVPPGPPHPPPKRQSPEWKDPELDQFHWRCGELGLSGLFHPRVPKCMKDLDKWKMIMMLHRFWHCEFSIFSNIIHI